METQVDMLATKQIGRALDACGVVGDQFREQITRGVTSGLLLRRGQDPLHISGEPGTGKSLVATVVHELAHTVLERGGARVDLDCSALKGPALQEALTLAAQTASHGTLVLDRMEALNADGLTHIERFQRSENDVLVVGLADAPTGLPGARVKLKPLHEREDDLWRLIEHYFAKVAEELPGQSCRGFSRQSKADIAARVQDASLKSVAVLRDIVRDCVYEAAAEGDLPELLTSELVRAVLEARYGQSSEDRRSRDAALVESAFEALSRPALVERLAEIHGVSPEVLAQQAEILRTSIETLDGLPKSYRNIMDRVDDIQRASLWLLSGAETQAEFRRFFGGERFMQPTKSVAWAFFNRVFKRDMG